jgi:hypothetical protein
VPTERYERDGTSLSGTAAAVPVVGPSAGGGGANATGDLDGSPDPEAADGPAEDERDTWDALSRGEDPT